MTRRFFGCLVLAASLLTAPLAAELGSGSPNGTVHLPSGLAVHYDYHYDRNALRDAHRAGGAIIALAESGNLLRLDLATMKLTREWFGPVPVVCLGRGEKDVTWAGFEDGRVCRIDPATLALTKVARLSGKPQWVGAVTDGMTKPAKSRLVVVVEQTKPVEFQRKPYSVGYSVVHDLGSGKTYALSPKSEF
jgi:hypothetical protein